MRAFIIALALPAMAPAEPIGFDDPRWSIQAGEHRIETHLDRQALYLKGGAAFLDGLEFLDGVIEFDIAVTGERGFMGAIWRRAEPGHYEEFYIRPHQSGNPDANQYTPIFNGAAGWQLYHGPGYGHPVEYPFDQWIPIRIEISGARADIYIGEGELPAVAARLKHTPRAGAIGLLSNGPYAGAHFSNLRVTTTRPELRGSPPSLEAAREGTILRWSVSTPLPESDLQDDHRLDANRLAGMNWQDLDAEATGITNLARLHPVGEAGNTVFARVLLESGDATETRLDFGYSDRVRVFLNGRLLYTGDNGYRSRDYRYLGTIGWFDQLLLPLQAGHNELIFAVSEDFGGWGLQARLDEPRVIALSAR